MITYGMDARLAQACGGGGRLVLTKHSTGHCSIERDNFELKLDTDGARTRKVGIPINRVNGTRRVMSEVHRPDAAYGKLGLSTVCRQCV